jgi:hypothetical protein
MALLSAAVASSATSQSINSGSLVFNPILTLDSPEASIRANPTVDTSTQFRDTSATSEARARATLSTSGGGADDSGGFSPGAGMDSANLNSLLSSDLVPRGAAGFLSSGAGLLLLGALAVGAYFVAKRYF